MTRKLVEILSASKLFRLMTPLVITGACLLILADKVALPPIAELWALTGQIPAANWTGALLATAVSFWSLGRYDAVAHRHLRTGFGDRMASRAGIASIAFSQTVGFGLLTGAFARWRLLPGLTPLQAAQLTGFVGITFLSALALICGLAFVLTADTSNKPLLCAVFSAALVAVTALCFRYPTWTVGRLSLRLPSLRALGALSLWTLVDITAAGTALWLLLPAGHGLSLFDLLPAYFLALGLAIVSSSPGGAGPLELALLTLLPAIDPATLVAGLLAFRIVYYGVPATIAGLLLLWPEKLGIGLAAQTRAFHDQEVRPAGTLRFERPQAESAIILQNGGHVLVAGLNKLAVLDSPQISVAFFDPLVGQKNEVPDALARHAHHYNTVPCIYKCSSGMAIAARKQGWKVLRIAADAIVNPQTFSDMGSSHRQLRRKLRSAEKSGLTVETPPEDLPLREMQEVDATWVENHGRALGTSMGQFEANYLRQQLLFIARQNGRLIGFVSFHSCAHEWTLDLVRQVPNAPDGTGHLLIRKAIDAAKDAGIARLSLSAVADHRYVHRRDCGLRRFKACFAPRWEPRYIAAPSWSAMALSVLELIRLIHRPAPVTPILSLARPIAEDTDPHIDHEGNEIALRRTA